MTDTVRGDLWSRPICVAPMAGGPTTTDLVVAATRAGAIAFVAGAYKSAETLSADITEVAAKVSGPFGVNVFVPGSPTSKPGELDRYVRALRSEAAALDVELGEAKWDDDDWDAKLDLLLERAPAVSSFTFGCPSAAAIKALQRVGSLVMVTVTSVVEALAALDAGADLLCAQGIEAGAHRGSFDDTAPDMELRTLDLLRELAPHASGRVVAAGGISTPADVRKALGAGAVAVQAGTAFLLSDEAGTGPSQRRALTGPGFSKTALTRAFTGRRARGLVNGLMRRHPDAPSAFPEVHHITSPLRTAAASAGDLERLNLWAGSGHRHTRAAPAAEIVDWLGGDSPG